MSYLSKEKERSAGTAPEERKIEVLLNMLSTLDLGKLN